MSTDYGEIAANYTGAFDGSLPFGKRPAIIVIDMVEAYLQPGSPLYAGIEAAVESAARLVAVARQCGAPVFFTNVE